MERSLPEGNQNSLDQGCIPDAMINANLMAGRAEILLSTGGISTFTVGYEFQILAQLTGQPSYLLPSVRSLTQDGCSVHVLVH